MTEILSALTSDTFLSLIRLADALGLLWPAIRIAAWTCLVLWLGWVFFVATMGVYRAHLAGALKARVASRVTRWLAYSLVAVALTADFIGQYTLAILFFMDWPRKGEHLITTRLKRYLQQAKADWRTARADWLCVHALNLWDPTGNHCGSAA